MNINWTIIIIVGLVILALLVLLIISNRNDRKDLEEKLNKDYPKPKGSESTSENESSTDLKV